MMFKGIKGTIVRHGVSGLGVYLVTKATTDFNFDPETIQSTLESLSKLANNIESILGLVIVMLAAGGSYLKDKGDKKAINKLDNFIKERKYND